MSRPIQVPTEELRQTVSRALAEDVGGGDLTAALIPTAATAEAQVICRDAALICGQPSPGLMRPFANSIRPSTSSGR